MTIKALLDNISIGVTSIHTILFKHDSRLDALQASQEAIEKTLISLLKKYEGIEKLEKALFDSTEGK